MSNPPELPNLDFVLDDGPGPARRIRAAEADRWIAGALDAAMPAPRRPKWVPIAVAAAALFALPAGAAVYQWVTRPAPPTPEAHPPEVAPPPEAREAPPPAAAPPEEAAPSPEPPAPRPRARPARPSPTPTRAVAPAPVRFESVDAALDAALDLRAARKWAEARGAYAAVVAEFPGTGGAYVARIHAAALDLEHLGRFRRAAAGYRRALDAGGPLDAEARWGLARALRATKDRAQERAVLQDLLQKHPDAPYAEAARARREALDRR